MSTSSSSGSRPLGSSASEASKQLREDALAYLDKVKTEFSEQPHIYNKFLEIMRAFMGKDINTPGVIKHVSELFRGHINLILGFNTFLPPGYKIEVAQTGNPGEVTTTITTPQGIMTTAPDGSLIMPLPPALARSIAMGPFASGSSSGVGAGSSSSSSSGGGASALGPRPSSSSSGAAGGSSSSSSGAPRPSSSSSGAGAGASSSGAARPGTSSSTSAAASSSSRPGGSSSSSSSSAPVRTGPPGAGPLDFDHAISYVTKIKKRFANDPATYRSFLEILHTYQKQHRNIKDVLERVSVLFRDHADLLRDFTYFLPDAVQESAKERLQRAAEAARARDREAAALDPAKTAAATGKSLGATMGTAGSRPAAPAGGMGGPTSARPGDSRYSGPAAGRGGFEAGTGPGGGASRGVLGRDRERVREADREAEREAGARADTDRAMARDGAEADRERERLMDRARDRYSVGMGPGRSPRMAAAARRRRGREEEMHLSLTPTERSFFGKLKAVLGGREAWLEALKCFDLYAGEVISRPELLALLGDIFGPSNAALLDDVKALLAARGTLDMTPEDVWYSMPVGEIDFTNAPRCTPSYRALPDGYPALACSERGRLEREVCNDRWVSVPTGSEDFSFKIMRKNAYEDALFRCEDERFEVDMVLDNNAGAIRALEPLAEEIAALKAFSRGVEWQFRLDRRSLGVLHLKAIARVYGEFGNEVLELLRKNPAQAIPTVLARLKQKDEEWRRARAELNKGWKEVMEKNYYKSLDHRSFYFKQHDKKHLQPKHLLGEMRAKVEALEGAVRHYLTLADEACAEAERRNTITAAGQRAEGRASGGSGMDVDAGGAGGEGGKASGDAPISGAALLRKPEALFPAALKQRLRAYAPQLTYFYRDARLHRDAAMLLAFAVEKQSSAADRGLVPDLWRTCLARFFQFPASYMRSGALAGYLNGYGTDVSLTVAAATAEGSGAAAASSSSSGAAASAGVLEVGHVVRTPFGLGVVESVRLGPFSFSGHHGLVSTAAGTAAALFGSRAGGAGAAGSAPAATAAAPTYHVTFPWGMGILQASTVSSAEGDLGAALAPASGALSGGAQAWSSGSSGAFGRVKPLSTAATTGFGAGAGAGYGNGAGPQFEGLLSRTVAAAGVGGPSHGDDDAAGAASLVHKSGSAAAAAGAMALQLVDSVDGVRYYACGPPLGVPAASPAAGAAAGEGGSSSSGGMSVDGAAGSGSAAAAAAASAAASSSGAASGAGGAGAYPPPPPECIMYTTAAGYVFFRLHQMLMDRLHSARILCARRASQPGGGAFGKPLVSHPAEKAFAALANQLVARPPGGQAAGAGAVGKALSRQEAAAATATASMLKDNASLAASAGTSTVPSAAGSAGVVAAVIRSRQNNEMRAAGAAAVGDLTGANVAAMAMDAQLEGQAQEAPAARSAQAAHAAQVAQVAEQTYQHFLTALCGVIEGSMEGPKFEDECRELMGTGAYVLFTMDRLLASAAKQLVYLAHDSSSVRLRHLWEHTQARIGFARATLPPEEAAGAVRAALGSYRANVSSALLARGGDDVFAVQYWPMPPELAAADDLSTGAAIAAATGGLPSGVASALASGPAAAATADAGEGFSSSAGAGAGGSSGSMAADVAAALRGAAPSVACLTLRYVGKPVYDSSASTSGGGAAGGARSTLRGYQYASALPSFLARTVGQGRVLMGDESVDEMEGEMAADEVERAAAAAAAAASSSGAGASASALSSRPRVRMPYLVRTLAKREGYTRVLSTVAAHNRAAVQAAAGGADGSAAAPALPPAGGPGVVTGDLAARVTASGGLQFVGGTEEALVRPPAALPAPDAAAAAASGQSTA